MIEKRKKSEVFIRLYPEETFLPIAVSFAEKASAAFGLEYLDSIALTLATDEVFSYLCRVSHVDRPVEIYRKGGSYYVQIEFKFTADNFNLRPFNITSKITPDNIENFEEVGLFLASRSVDSFHMKKKNKDFHLTLIKEKSYPQIEPLSEIEAKPLSQFSVSWPDKDEIKLFVQMANKYCNNGVLPLFFKYPGKIVDMVSGGEYFIALVFGPSGEIGGGILWTYREDKRAVECFGPYIFNQPEEHNMRNALMDVCLSSVAKTQTAGLLRYCSIDEVFDSNFDELGSLYIFNQNGEKNLFKAFFRQINEDPGCNVWSHGRLEDFLKEIYEDLVLPRDIRRIYDGGESKELFSVIGSIMLKPRGLVFLNPIQSGKDIKENLLSHLKFFAIENIKNIFFELDLSFPWHSEFTVPLMEIGFKPRILIPYGGEGDLVIFQYEEEH